MNLFVDTSVWSLALRRDQPPADPHVAFLARALGSGDSVFSTGLVLQELLQGFSGPKARKDIVSRFGMLPFVIPDRDDHIHAAELRNACRRRGVQVGTIDALLAQLCIRHDLVMLTTDADFQRVAKSRPLQVWRP
ncbi:MAG: PIN domain-containing protein [Candidatus Binatia bacterium]